MRPVQEIDDIIVEFKCEGVHTIVSIVVAFLLIPHRLVLRQWCRKIVAILRSARRAEQGMTSVVNCSCKSSPALMISLDVKVKKNQKRIMSIAA